MAYKIVWSSRAIKSYNAVVDYLEENWSNKVADDFAIKTSNIIELLSAGNVVFRDSYLKNSHEVNITKHNLLVYRVYKNEIRIITLFDTRQHPVKKKM